MKDKEIRALLDDVKKTLENGGSLTAVFERTGEKTNRATGSVRNFYYSLVKRAAKDAALREKYPALRAMSARKKQAFSKEEEEELVKKVDEKIKSGKSVRRAIKELSSGDEKLALRYQNKYRNATSARRGVKSSSYQKICDAIDKLIEKLKGVYSTNDCVIKENERLRKELPELKGDGSGSKVVAFFGDSRKRKTDKK